MANAISGLNNKARGRWARRGSVLLAAWALWPLFSGPASAARCPKAEALPRVSLSTSSGRVTYNTRHSRRDLQRLRQRPGGPGQVQGWLPIGLTLAELQLRMNISVSTMPRAKRRHCATLAKVEASLGYDKITVYIANRYRKGSCQYLSVLAHENEHVAIFRDNLAVFAPKVERRLAQAAARLKPVTAGSPGRAAAKIQKLLQREMEPLFKEMNRKLNLENDRIDTIENYKQEQTRCSTW